MREFIITEAKSEEAVLVGLITKTQNAVGNPTYDVLMIFKILLLQTWYGLSDYEI